LSSLGGLSFLFLIGAHWLVLHGAWPRHRRPAAVAVDEAITKWKNPKPILVQDLVSDGITNTEQRHLASDGTEL
jgi:hypothetical protein